MSTQSYEPYRGCFIEVHVTPSKALALGGLCRRYRVSWTVSSPDHLGKVVANFPEQFDFLSEEAAFKYGESRAHTFVDSVMSVPSTRRATGENSERAGGASAA